MCMPFYCSHQINYIFFSQIELKSYIHIPKHTDTGYLVNATPSTILTGSLKLCRCFCQGLKMCMRFGCNIQTIFVTLFAI